MASSDTIPDTTSQPTTRNPLIEEHTIDTLENVHNILCFIEQTLLTSPDLCQEQHARAGFHLLLGTMTQALQFEMYRCQEPAGLV